MCRLLSVSPSTKVPLLVHISCMHHSTFGGLPLLILNNKIKLLWDTSYLSFLSSHCCTPLHTCFTSSWYLRDKTPKSWARKKRHTPNNNLQILNNQQPNIMEYLLLIIFILLLLRCSWWLFFFLLILVCPYFILDNIKSGNVVRAKNDTHLPTNYKTPIIKNRLQWNTFF